MKINKTCYCGNFYAVLPENHKAIPTGDMAGWWFDCSCKSTIFIPNRIEIDKARALQLIKQANCQHFKIDKEWNICIDCGKEVEPDDGADEAYDRQEEDR